jgi:hypothetical protein
MFPDVPTRIIFLSNSFSSPGVIEAIADYHSAESVEFNPVMQNYVIEVETQVNAQKVRLFLLQLIISYLGNLHLC